MRVSVGLLALSAVLLSGCIDSLQFSGGRSAALSPDDDLFQERGEADEQPNNSIPTEEGGGETPE